MAETFSSGLEFCAGTLAQGVCHHGRKSCAVKIFQKRLGLQDFEHLFSVVFPVCCAVQVSVRCYACGKQTDKIRANEASFMVASLSPGIREVDVYAGKRILGDHVAHDFNGVVPADADVLQSFLLDELA